jgi:chitin deacetylase
MKKGFYKNLVVLIFCLLAFKAFAHDNYFPYAFLDKCLGFKGAITNEKVVAITFDDGPSKYTDDVLAMLGKYGVKATFFVIGENILHYQRLLQKADHEGHIIGIHTYTHPHMNHLPLIFIKRQLRSTADLIYSLIGKYPVLYRPPYGSCSYYTSEEIKRMGYKTITWSSIADDYFYKITTPEKITRDIMALVKPGVIINLHDGGGNRVKTVKALPMIIEELEKKHYKIVTIPELLSISAYGEI